MVWMKEGDGAGTGSLFSGEIRVPASRNSARRRDEFQRKWLKSSTSLSPLGSARVRYRVFGRWGEW